MDRTPVRDAAPACGRVVALASLLALAPASAALPHASRHGAASMPPPHTAALLVDYYEAFRRDRDLGAFRLNVLGRYSEGTLARLVQSGDAPARRAAVLALGLVGSYRVNEVVGKALRDPDASVRSLAENALWAIWFRADTPENNACLQQVHDLINRGRSAEAIDLATRLIDRAPGFAEAYNQRAIAHFGLGHFADSAADCRRVLERNPYHIGALAGLGKCYLQLHDRDAAIKALRRALKLQPYSDELRETISALEEGRL
jgi:tetratricopeptide (TPR) repeat protein